MSRERKEGFKLVLGGLFVGVLSLYFLGPAAEGVGVLNSLPLPGWAWGMLFLMCGIVMVWLGMKAVIKG